MAKTPEEMAGEINEKFASLKQELEAVKAKETATPQEVKAAQEALENFKKENDVEVKSNKETVQKLADGLKDAEAEIKSLKEQGTKLQNVNFTSAVAEALKENHDGLKSFVGEKQKGGYFSIEVKAPAAFASTNITSDATPDNYAASNATMVSDYIRDQIFVEQYLSVGSTDQPSIPYVDETAGEGDAAMVAEGGLKPLIDADYNVKYSTAKKVAGRMKASEEALSDFKWLQGKLTGTLKRKHDIARQNNILTGDGLGANLLGIASLATAFNPTMLGTLADTFPVAGQVGAANNYDVIAAMINAVITQSEGTFIPNVVFVNNIDLLSLKLEKDSQGRYLFKDIDRNIDGVQVVAQPSLPSGEFIIGDLKNVQLENVWGYTVRFGWENDDFSKNMITMIGESRLHLYISENDKRGIIKGTFADVKAGLNADV